MDILEQYQRILTEISQCASLAKGNIVGGTRTFSLGRYYSEITNGEVYIALKEGFMGKKRAVDELSIIRIIARHYHHLIPQLPLFLGLLVNNDGTPLGIITEDFSRGGAYEMQDGYENHALWYNRNHIEPMRLINKLLTSEDGDVDVDVAKMCFLVGGHIRLGDFDSLPMLIEDGNPLREELGTSELEREIEKFTVRTNNQI